MERWDTAQCGCYSHLSEEARARLYSVLFWSIIMEVFTNYNNIQKQESSLWGSGDPGLSDSCSGVRRGRALQDQRGEDRT